uniref:Uncharacterized protein n=1 Tax=Pseudonaja textilis TaxID=8673 RepID=A0A670Y9J5_PSETE
LCTEKLTHLLSKLGGQLFRFGFFKLSNPSNRFGTEDVSTPVSYLIVSLVVVGLNSFHQFSQGSFVLTA